MSDGPTEAINAQIKNVKRVGSFRRSDATDNNNTARGCCRRRSRLATLALAGSACQPDQKPLTTLGGEEPDVSGLQVA